MRTLGLCLLLLSTLVLRGEPLGEWESLQSDRLPPAWAELFERLREPDAVYARFVERRQFSFRQDPVEVRGELRLDRRHGLSLHYIEPTEQTVIVDEQGVLLRDAARRTRPAPAAAVESTRPLRDVLRLDLGALEQSFTVRGRRSDAGWELELAPRSGRGGRAAGGIHLSGTREHVERITIQPTERRRVEIELQSIATDASFGTAEVQRFFR